MDFGELKILMISTDRNVLSAGSKVAERMKGYGTLVQELHIVLLCDKSHGLKETQLSSNVFVYPTNSMWKFFRSHDAAALGKKLILKKQFVRGKAVITAQDPFECGLAGLKIKKKWRLPLEVQLHTDPFSPQFTGNLNKVRLRIARKVLPQADRVRVVMQSLARNISQEFNISMEKIFVLPIYVNEASEEYPSFNLHDRFGWQTVIISVARLSPEKNLGLALEAMQKVSTLYPTVGLAIVGDGPEKERLEKLSQELGVDKHVAFVGWQDDVSSFYKTADIFLQTSNFEGYGLSLIEAGRAVLPVVSTPVGIARELSGEDLLIVESNADAVADALVQLITKPSDAKALGVHLKQTLAKIILSKEQYLQELKTNWEKVALQAR